jgi:hypothetical protein
MELKNRYNSEELIYVELVRDLGQSQEQEKPHVELVVVLDFKQLGKVLS